jgi:hypothetical protein
LVERPVDVQQAGRRTSVAECLGDVAQDLVVDAVGDFRPERGFIHVGIDVDHEPILELLFGRAGLGEIIAGIGARGNLLELGDPRRGFADIHVSSPALI